MWVRSTIDRTDEGTCGKRRRQLHAYWWQDFVHHIQGRYLEGPIQPDESARSLASSSRMPTQHADAARAPRALELGLFGDEELEERAKYP
jgi:hypothetical protein